MNSKFIRVLVFIILLLLFQSALCSAAGDWNLQTTSSFASNRLLSQNSHMVNVYVQVLSPNGASYSSPAKVWFSFNKDKPYICAPGKYVEDIWLSIGDTVWATDLYDESIISAKQTVQAPGLITLVLGE